MVSRIIKNSCAENSINACRSRDVYRNIIAMPLLAGTLLAGIKNINPLNEELILAAQEKHRFFIQVSTVLFLLICFSNNASCLSTLSCIPSLRSSLYK